MPESEAARLANAAHEAAHYLAMHKRAAELIVSAIDAAIAAAGREALEVVEDLVIQFGYATENPPGVGTMGLSALEGAFELLGWEDPHPLPTMGCDEPGCGKRSTCGWPSGTGYRRTCGDHWRTY